MCPSQVVDVAHTGRKARNRCHTESSNSESDGDGGGTDNVEDSQDKSEAESIDLASAHLKTAL